MIQLRVLRGDDAENWVRSIRLTDVTGTSYTWGEDGQPWGETVGNVELQVFDVRITPAFVMGTADTNNFVQPAQLENIPAFELWLHEDFEQDPHLKILEIVLAGEEENADDPQDG
ncbi:hypothetical protein [Polycladidibacter hongkongensis]|uniref:hypothetical protein n=1 Tax=Polycladidibacter hongkongensis TaxID=1647556 RepID=UPI00082AD181|nr:hypothetical protein [Pseudovibrio hongkongensis]